MWTNARTGLDANVMGVAVRTNGVDLTVAAMEINSIYKSMTPALVSCKFCNILSYEL